MLSWLLSLLLPFLLSGGVAAETILMPAHTLPADNEEQEWAAYHAEALMEYEAEFTVLFQGYETKWSKNGRLMIRTGDAGPYKFVKKGA